MKDGNLEQPGMEISENHQRAGIVEDFVSLLKETVPVLDKIKNSIEESTGKIPAASEHLSAVNKVTESATLYILKDVESMSAGIDSTISDLKKYQSSLSSDADMIKDFVDRISNCVDTFRGAGLYHDLSLMNDFIQKLEETKSFEDIHNHLADIKKSTLNIAITLQMQDIAAQQINAVSSLIEFVRIQLMRVLNHFDSTPGLTSKTVLQTPVQSDLSDDTHLIDVALHYTQGIDRQNFTDEIVKEWSNMNKII